MYVLILVKLTVSRSMACCVFIQISPDAVQSFRCHFTTFNGSIREQLQVYLTYSKCNSVPPPRDGVRGVTVTKTGSGVTVASAKSERKNGISVQNTNSWQETALLSCF